MTPFSSQQIAVWERSLVRFLPKQRWFGAKSRSLQKIKLHTLFPLGNSSLAIVGAQFKKGPKELYLMPLIAGGGGRPVDALENPVFAKELLSAVLGKKPPSIPVSRLLETEQSNSSIIYGQKWILKLYRKVSDGINPDIELGAFLTRDAKFKNSPALEASLEWSHGKNTCSLASLQHWVPNQGDTWSYLQSELNKRKKKSTFSTEPFQEFAEKLGVRTFEMHASLAHPLAATHEDLKPEVFTLVYQKQLYRQMIKHAKQVLSLLEERMKTLPAELRPKAKYLLAHQTRLLSGFKPLLQTQIKATRIRIHGDFHLGQVLYTKKDFCIIDYEGEPARSMSERRAKQSPLRDIAGMLRSFHYAACMGVPDRDFQEIWYGRTREAYLKGYLSAYNKCTQPFTPFLPTEVSSLSKLLDIYVLEKAFYELSYELNNRPDWVKVPLSGILQILDRIHHTQGNQQGAKS